MAKYTIELRRLCDYYGRDEVENYFKDYTLEEYLTPIEITQITQFNIWSKDKLATKIVDYYYMREIGFETPELFKHYAHITMKMIMERQLPKIYSNFLEYDPLSNVDYIEEYTRELKGEQHQEGNSNSNSSNNASSLNINSDTPQGQIDKINILNGKYATTTSANENSNDILDNTKSEGKGSSSSIEKFRKHAYGDNGVIITNQRLVKEYREIIIAIDEEIIMELNKLFMGLY